MPRNHGNRKWETLCPVCDELVGVVNTSWNRGANNAFQKTSRHYDKTLRICGGSQLSVPASVVMPGPGFMSNTSTQKAS